MPELGDWGKQTSPFHAGEQAIQERLGLRDRMEGLGRRVIRPYLPEQHRAFLSQLPFVVVGHVDERGAPWASLLAGPEGFLSSPDPQTIVVEAAAMTGDPLAAGLRPGSALGLLAIELESRRRNRVNARVADSDGRRLVLSVDQSFGNCPQYIQARPVRFVEAEQTSARPANAVERFAGLSAEAAAHIRSADTFFVSSYVEAGSSEQADIEGVDVSHRGGRPGFVKVEDHTLTIPDFSGNAHFNTLGNFLRNPKAGLCFVDFETGDVLMLTGSVELLWEDEPEVRAFQGAERAWRVAVEEGVWLRRALPLRAAAGEASANNALTGDWQSAEAAMVAEAQRDVWRPFRVARIEDESEVIRSFYLEPDDEAGLSPYRAGQFLTIRVQSDPAEAPITRTYTLSSAPGERSYRISVKREPASEAGGPEGRVSSHLHDRVSVADRIEVRAPRGDFSLDAAQTRPAVLLAAGVGITPMISMARHVAAEGRRTRHLRPLTIFHAARTTDERAFHDELRALEESSAGLIRYVSIISRPAAHEKAGVDWNGSGRIDAQHLRQTLALDDYDFFLCGPGEFMQAMYEVLLELGVRDERIAAEAFGPASLRRRRQQAKAVLLGEPEEAEQAVVRFSQSGFEQAWTPPAGTLLELAEAHGLSPDYGCRGGACGQCAVPLSEGSVHYRTQPSATPGEGEVLLCCAVPAHGSDTLGIDL